MSSKISKLDLSNRRLVLGNSKVGGPFGDLVLEDKTILMNSVRDFDSKASELCNQ